MSSEAAAVIPVDSKVSPTNLVIFVHGWKGNTRELSYLRRSMQHQASESVICYAATCNVKKTNDGVEKGGQRLALEVEEQLEKIDGPVSLSFVGYSLGGLYSRYAIAHLGMSSRITPSILCTIATPHLGVHKQTWMPVWIEKLVGMLFGPTMRDVLLQTPIITEMGTRAKYLAPLQRFKKRIAVANAYKTDCFVSTTSAAFLSASSRTLHSSRSDLDKHDSYALSLETQPSQSFDSEDMAENLDALGWTKVMLDVRSAIPLPSFPNPFARPEKEMGDKSTWTSLELIQSFDRIGNYWKLPFGHPVACASYKNWILRWFTMGGAPIMDQLAQDLLGCMALS